MRAPPPGGTRRAGGARSCESPRVERRLDYIEAQTQREKGASFYCIADSARIYAGKKACMERNLQADEKNK